LDFADDIAIMEHDALPRGMRLKNMEQTGEKIGLKISSSKTKVLEMNTTSRGVKVNSKDIESVSQFTYLGSLVTDDNQTDAEMKTRFGKAAGAVNKLSKIWNNRSFSVKVKMRLYNSIIVPIVLYAAETWAVTKTMEKRMDSFDSRNLRRILKIRWQDKVHTSSVREKTGQCPLSIILQKRLGMLIPG